MKFEASRAKAIDKLDNFVEQNLNDYSKSRNFDFGPNNRSNISCLSSYITHGIINELEVVDKSLNTTKNTAPKPSNEYLSKPSSPGRKMIKTPKNPNTSATTTCLFRTSLKIR